VSRIAAVFNRDKRVALIPYITVGYPSVEATLKVVPLLAASGCDIIELGVPFSDPLADGVTIQNASFQALKNGVTPELCLVVAKELSQKTDVPLVFMTYFNPVFNYGMPRFCRECATSGVDGLIIPDLPPDEGFELEAICRKEKLDLIYLVSPTSNTKRIKLVAERSSGFIYLVSVTGVTGTREKLAANLKAFVARVRAVAHQPLCVGFGIATLEQAKQVARIADGVIIGSRIIQLMEADDNFVSLGNFIKSVRVAIG